MTPRSDAPRSALNLAGRVAQYFVDSKLTILIGLVALLAGLLAVLITPREENPRIVVPAANIIVSKPGASPAEVEQLIVKPLEAILQGLRGVEHTYGTAMDSLGVVNVQFYVGENKETALVRVYDRIMSNLDRMPPGTRMPLVKPLDVDDVPILTISLASTASCAASPTTSSRTCAASRRYRFRSCMAGGRARSRSISIWSACAATT